MIAGALWLAALVQQSVAPGVGWDGFPVIVYRQQYSGREAPAPLLAPFGGVHVRGAEPADWVVERGLDFYVEHAAERDVLHLDRDSRDYQRRWHAWQSSRDDALLVREPCLTDPATVRRLERALDASLDARGGAFGLGYSLGDEVSTTPAGGPDDACLSPTCRAAWREFLERQGLLERAAARGFDDPANASTDAALARIDDGDWSAIEGWLLRRRFHHQVLEATLARLAARARERRPAAPLGLMGLAGESAFGNVAVERALELVDFVEPYRCQHATELAFTLRGERQRVLATVFAQRSAPAAWSWAAYDHWMRGGDGLVVWCDRDLEQSSELYGSLARAANAIRELERELGDFAPRPSGVAVLESRDSTALCWLVDARGDGDTWPHRFQGYQEDRGTREASLRSWFELLEDCGAMPGALPIGRVDASTVERFPLLIASHLIVLERDDVERLERFLAAGGTLCVHGELGRLDPRGARPATPVLERLAASYKGRVFRAPSDVDAYAATLAEPLRATMRGRMRIAGVARAPVELADASARALIAADRSVDGTWRVAILPKVLGLGRTRLNSKDSPRPKVEPVELALVFPADLEPRVLRGEGRNPFRLAAGEPLVIELAPRAR